LGFFTGTTLAYYYGTKLFWHYAGEVSAASARSEEEPSEEEIELVDQRIHETH
jgi:hypothetical protein